MRRWVSLFVLLLTLAEGARAGDLYLNIIWHQHQPLYVDPETDQLRGPWVRTHATKDYYDMAAMHRAFPEIHATVNLTSSLLLQLQDYYVARLGPYLYRHEDGQWAVRADSFLARWRGKTDPWIDLALRLTASFDSTDRAVLLTNSWNAFGISDVQIARFPEYQAMRARISGPPLSDAELTEIKAWFYLAHFDPDFLRGTARLDVNLNDLLEERSGIFYGRHPLGERDANRLVADAVRVMMAIVPEHKELQYDAKAHRGQLEIITTPFYHPILPLLIDSDVARVCQPRDSLPPGFAYPEDAEAQVAKAIRYYETLFGQKPAGMWPAEGSVSEAAAAVFAGQGVRWIAGDMRVLAKSTPLGLPVAAPYRVETGVETKTALTIVFRETTLSDHIGFTYQNLDPDSAARHFLAAVLRYRPQPREGDRLLTVILDGENAWEWYAKDMDGKRFLHALYAGLTAERAARRITCVTPTEYIRGNPARKIPAHPVKKQTRIAKLWPGSWINANFDTWIGEDEENRAWEYLLETRNALAASGLPEAALELRTPGDPVWQAYEAMYAAEGSDWFWWYGADQSAPGGDRPFEEAFFSHLKAVYRHMQAAGATVTVPDFAPILSAAKVRQQGGGVMAQSRAPVSVRFVVDASAQTVAKAIYIAGNLPELGAWQPNTVRLWDDGTHGDSLAGDHRWTLEIRVPVGSEVQYKYTNSGQPGEWAASEEFAATNRSFTAESAVVRRDVFGEP